MEELHVAVRGIRKNEYLQSLRRVALKPYLWMWVIVAAVVAVLTVFTGDTRPQSFLIPLAILLVLPLIYEWWNRSNGKNLDLDQVEIDYWLDERGWRMEANGNRAVFIWSNTRLVETRDDLLLYTDQRTSSLLPKRCLTAEEQAQIQTWARSQK